MGSGRGGRSFYCPRDTILTMKKLFILALLLLFCSATPNRGTSLMQCQNKKVSLFLNSIWSDAELIAHLYGIPLELILAQSCQETGFGLSKKCQQNCNYFGVQHGNYDNKTESFFDYGRVLTLPCYENLQPKTLEEWLAALECCGYAGDKNYTKSLRKIIAKWIK